MTKNKDDEIIVEGKEINSEIIEDKSKTKKAKEKVSGIFDNIKKAAKSGTNTVRVKYGDLKLSLEQERKYNEVFLAATKEFEIKGTKSLVGSRYSFRAFIDYENKQLFIPIKQDNLTLLRVGCYLIKEDDNTEIRIDVIERDPLTNVPLMLDDTLKHSIECYKVSYS